MGARRVDLETQLPSAAEGSDASNEERRGALGSAASAAVRGILAKMHADSTRRSKLLPPGGSVHVLGRECISCGKQEAAPFLFFLCVTKGPGRLGGPGPF